MTKVYLKIRLDLVKNNKVRVRLKLKRKFYIIFKPTLTLFFICCKKSNINLIIIYSNYIAKVDLKIMKEICNKLVHSNKNLSIIFI